jgi:threonine/homoserine/homoserine lactone efflux protein
LAPREPFAPNHPWDHNFFALLVALMWLGVLGGFVPEVIQHVAKHQKPFPWIIHVHAVFFMGWLVLLTAQVGLIRLRRPDLHRRLGALMVFWAAAMIVVGPTTAVVMDRLHLSEGAGPDATAFFAVQGSDILSFALLVGAAFLLRGQPSAHKRLMLLGTLYITDAGFGRLLGDPISHLLGRGEVGSFLGLYAGVDLLVLGLGAYDLITRRRLHPAYLAGVAWIFLCQVSANAAILSPAWKALSVRLIG